MEQHHPIMDKLGGIGGRTYRQTDKNNHYVSYNACREALVYDIIRVAKEYTMKILDDLFAKIMPKVVRNIFLDMFMY